MAQIEKIEAQLEIKSSAEKFYEILRSKRYLFPKMCPDLIKDVKLVKGDWESVGSMMEWTFIPSGNSETIKEIVEAIDDENKKITYKALEGDITKYYKNTKATLHVSGLGKGGSSLKSTLEYEKLNNDFPAPTKYLEVFQAIAKNIDAYLTKSA